MTDPLLRTAQRHLVPVIVVLSLIVLWRGHNLPGGGFIGGLVAAMAGVLVYLGEGREALRKALRVPPEYLLVGGLTVALVSALWGWLAGTAFFAAGWLPAVTVPLLGKILLGTPLLFDVGVYLVVVGFSLTVLLSFERMEQWKS